MRRLIYLAAAVALIAGCEETDKTPRSMRVRQDQALRDPFNYNPQVKETVGGGGTMDLDKEALRRDWKAVVDP